MPHFIVVFAYISYTFPLFNRNPTDCAVRSALPNLDHRAGSVGTLAHRRSSAEAACLLQATSWSALAHKAYDIADLIAVAIYTRQLVLRRKTRTERA